jgi:hypothetical protein
LNARITKPDDAFAEIPFGKIILPSGTRMRQKANYGQKSLKMGTK